MTAVKEQHRYAAPASPAPLMSLDSREMKTLLAGPHHVIDLHLLFAVRSTSAFPPQSLQYKVSSSAPLAL